MRKRLLPLVGVWVMLLALLFGSFGSFMLYDISVKQNRMIMNDLLRQSEGGNLVALDIPLSEVHNSKTFEQNHPEEIVYKGHLYDVVKKMPKKDSIVFYCINDTKEETLNTELNNQVKILFDQAPSGKTHDKTFSKNPLQEYVPVFPVDINTLNSNNSLSFRSFVASSYTSVYKDILTPPPAKA